ncbi:MAG: NTP transferase domain-containing protein [Polyangiaceae bacterium]|nr:NTP transferase domain-containing protein [Polyangiaceae bacterium]
MDPKLSDVAMLIVASGRGERMGGPKALLSWGDGSTLVAAHADLGARTCSRVVVVARGWVAKVLRPQLPGSLVVPSSAPGVWGPAGSVAAAVRAGVFSTMRWVLVVPVDMVPVDERTLAILRDAAAMDVRVVRPCLVKRDGQSQPLRGGHPVLVRADVLVESFLADKPAPLREVLRGFSRVDVCVDDCRVATNLDTPEAYRRWMNRAPEFVY